MTRSILSIVVLMLCCASAVAFEVGETVVAIREATIQRDGVKVDDVWLGQELKIESIKGELFWVNSDHPGWIRQVDVEQLDRAEELFSNLIEKNPDHAPYYNARGVTRCLIGRRDRKPIVLGQAQEQMTKDFDTAIRLQPIALYYRCRGNWNMHDMRKATQDLDESIRLSPTAAAYADRGFIKAANHFNARDGGDSDEDFAEAIRLDPTSIRPYFNRIKPTARTFDLPRHDDWSKVIELDPYNDDAYAGRGRAWAMKGERLRALLDFNKAIKNNPRNASAYEDRALIQIHLRQFEKAIEDYDAAAALGAYSDIVNGSRAHAYIQLGQYDKAIQDFTDAINRQPKSPALFRQRGNCRRLNGEYELAISDLQRSIELAEQTRMELEKVFFTYNGLAWLCATCPDAKFRDGPKSLELAKKACGLNGGGTPYDHDTLAAAYAELGEFDEAIKYQNQAVMRAPEKKKDEYTQRLELYRSKKPFREVPKKKT